MIDIASTVMIVFVCAATVAMIMIMRQLRELHLTMNSRLDELLATTKSLARAEGFKAGQEDHLAAIRDWKE